MKSRVPVPDVSHCFSADAVLPGQSSSCEHVDVDRRQSQGVRRKRRAEDKRTERGVEKRRRGEEEEEEAAREVQSRGFQALSEERARMFESEKPGGSYRTGGEEGKEWRRAGRAGGEKGEMMQRRME
eukprot:688925-Hanusia_phi.AAC.1